MKHKKSQEELKKKIATADLLLSIFSFEKVKRCTAVLLLTIKSNFKKTRQNTASQKDKLKHEFSHLKKWNDVQRFFFLKLSPSSKKKLLKTQWLNNKNFLIWKSETMHSGSSYYNFKIMAPVDEETQNKLEYYIYLTV